MSIENLLGRLQKVKSTSSEVIKSLPDRDYLNQCFELSKTGNLVWKVRPRFHFNSPQAHFGFNKRFAGTVAGCDMGKGYYSVSINSTRYKVHRIIYHIAVGDANAYTHIDHVNGNPSDNRPENLRGSDASKNAINFKGARADSSSKVRGVTWKKKNQKWESWVIHQGKRLYLGLFETLKEAETISANKRLELYGDAWSSQNGH